MAGRYHETPFQNSTPVLTPFWRRQHVRAKSMLRASPVCKMSISSLPVRPRDASSHGSYPFHYPVFVQALGLFPRSRRTEKQQESLFLVCLWKKNSRFSPLSCPFRLPAPLYCPKVSFRFNAGDLGAAPGALSQGPSSLTICKGFTRALSTVRTQWRCGPVTRPVAPTFPSTSPASRISPTLALISDRCP